MKTYAISVPNVGPNTFDYRSLGIHWKYGSDIIQHIFKPSKTQFQFNNYKTKDGTQCDLYYVIFFDDYNLTQEDIVMIRLKYNIAVNLEREL